MSLHTRFALSKSNLSSVILAATSAVMMATNPAAAQDEPPNGMRPTDLRTHAITNATVITSPGEQIENATIIIKDGIITSVGSDVAPPADARVWDAEGLMVYPGLIDPAMLVDAGTIERGPHAHWNRHIHPQISAADLEAPSESARKSLREVGFTVAAVYPEDGILRGSGVVLSLADENHEPTIFIERAAMAAGFDRGGGYPSSLMGSIAAFRQAIYDSRWYRDANKVYNDHPAGNEPPEHADAFEAMRDVVDNKQQIVFEVDDELNFLRAAKLLKEFELDGMILGSGMEFKRLDEVVATGLPILVPLNFPERPDVSSFDAADSTTLETLLTWEQAPTNPRRLADAGATIAFTTHGLDKQGAVFSSIRRAVNNGLSEDAALEAMTISPATLLGLEDIIGTIEVGKVANLVVVDGPLFAKKSEIRDTWIDGQRYEINVDDSEDQYTGKGVLKITQGNAKPIETPIEIDTQKKKVVIEMPRESESGGEVDVDDGETASEESTPTDESESDEAAESKPESLKAKSVTFNGSRLSFLIDGKLLDAPGYVQMVGTLTEGEFVGSGSMPDLSRFTFVIEADETETVTNDEASETASDDVDESTNTEQPAADDTEPPDPISGTWSAVISGEQLGGEMPVTVNLTLGDNNTVTGSLESEFFNADISNGTFNADNGEFTMTVSGSGMTSNIEGRIKDNQMTGTISGEGFAAEIAGSRAAGATDVAADTKSAEEDHIAPEELVYPLGAYGLSEQPAQQSVLITNATIWTSGPDGIIENGWMIVSDGKITSIGSGPVSTGTFDLEIDAAGKHITPGLLDCHSHTGINGGVNEGSQVVTAEVRIEDCINPDDINWYRQLAGGLTAANQLHGSANPIGGQNSVVKLKWSGNPDDFSINSAKPGIKFALGENVKRSQNRYPNTRMGVETVIRDSFTEARDYQTKWKKYEALSQSERAKAIPPRRDLELDTLVEILEGERLVHCHSYRQDEILMLLRVAEDFGFTIGTLQHILEGYKVAEVIAAHGAGASSFSDWWAYKVEVMDAIPYNGAIMHDVGVLVSFNSDDSELARRMNTEAAKAVRYGNVSPEEALKFVTLNPAKQLRVDDRIGSLEVGKDADFVIWSDDPLSTYARCEQTWIEGARYFDLETDQQLRQQISSERQRLIQTILSYEHGSLESSETSED